MATFNIQFGTKRLILNIDPDFRTPREMVNWVAKQFSIDPAEYLNRDLELRDPAPAALDQSLPLASQGYHVGTYDAGQGKDDDPDFPATAYPGDNGRAMTLELHDPNDAAFNEDFARFPVADTPPSIIVP